MTKIELIDQISSVNRSATREFLSEFTNHELADYVRQLRTLDLLPGDDSSAAGGAIGSHHAATA